MRADSKKRNARPKVLLLDIESAPHRVFAWGLWAQDIHLDQIEEPGYTMCFAAKWLGQRPITFKSVFHDGKVKMLRAAYDLIEEADIVVHFNGSKYDMPQLAQEFASLGWPPPSPYKEIDLLQVVRRRFRMASNKLDWVLRFFGLGTKMKHKGMELWRDCMKGVESSWRVMKSYNIKDVRMSERLYLHILPWVPAHPNVGLWRGGAMRPVCSHCGSEHVVKKGIEYARTRAYQRWKCMGCGAPLRSVRCEKGSSVMLTGL